MYVSGHMVMTQKKIVGLLLFSLSVCLTNKLIFFFPLFTYLPLHWWLFYASLQGLVQNIVILYHLCSANRSLEWICAMLYICVWMNVLTNSNPECEDRNFYFIQKYYIMDTPTYANIYTDIHNKHTYKHYKQIHRTGLFLTQFGSNKRSYRVNEI